MKIFICILAIFIGTAHGGFLSKSRGPQQGWSGPPRQQRQSRPPQVIKVIHSQVRSAGSHATIPTAPIKIIKVIQESGPSVADLRSSNAAPAKIIKVLNQQDASSSLVPSKIIRVIHHNDAASNNYARAADSQDTKIVKIISDQSANSYSAPVEQDVKVFKVFKQNGGGLSSQSSSSYGSGQNYANGYSYGRSAPSSSVVKVIKVVDQPSQYASRSKW